MARAALKKRERVEDVDVRARVLAGAVKIIGEQGLDALSMREVARAAGVSHQAPYHYFEDRESILAAIALEGFTILTMRLENAATQAEGTAVDRLTELGRTYVHFACDQPALFRVMFRPDCVHPGRFPDVEKMGDRAFQALERAVANAIEEGVEPDPSSISLVVLAWSLSHGLACLLLDGPLGIKLPHVETSRDAVIDQTMLAMQRLLEARVGPKKKSKRR